MVEEKVEVDQIVQMDKELLVVEEDEVNILPDQNSGDGRIGVLEENEEEEKVDCEVVEQEVEWMELVGEEVVIDGQIPYEVLI